MRFGHPTPKFITAGVLEPPNRFARGAESCPAQRRPERTPGWSVGNAAHEGIKLEFFAAPVRIVEKNGRVGGVEFQRMALGAPDASGRQRPVPGVKVPLPVLVGPENQPIWSIGTPPGKPSPRYEEPVRPIGGRDGRWSHVTPATMGQSARKIDWSWTIRSYSSRCPWACAGAASLIASRTALARRR